VRDPRRLVEYLDRTAPRRFLRRVDFAQIKHVPLQHAPAAQTLMLHHAVVAVFFAIHSCEWMRVETSRHNIIHIDAPQAIGKVFTAANFTGFEQHALKQNKSLRRVSTRSAV